MRKKVYQKQMEDPKSKTHGADARLLQSNTFQKHIEATQRELKEQLNDHQRYIKTVENELAHLQLQLKLNVGPRKMASEFLRGKIEAQNEVLAGVRRRHAEAKKVLAACEAELHAEEQEKDRLCSELNLLVAESTAAQVAKLEELKNHLDMLSRWSSRMGHSTSSAEADGLCQQAHAFATGAGLQVPQPPGTHTPTSSQNPSPSQKSPAEQTSPTSPVPATHTNHTPLRSNGSAEARAPTNLPSHHTNTTPQPSSQLAAVATSQQPRQTAAAVPSIGIACGSAQRAVDSSIPKSSTSSVTAYNPHCEAGVSTLHSSSSHLNSSPTPGIAGSANLGDLGQGDARSTGLEEGSCTQAPRAPRRGSGRKPLSAGRIPRSGMPMSAESSVNSTMHDAAASPSATVQGTGTTEAAVAHVLHHGVPSAAINSTHRHAVPIEQHTGRPRKSNFTVWGGAQQYPAPQPALEAQQHVAATVTKGKGEFSGFDV